MKRSILLLVLVPVFAGCSNEPAPPVKTERAALTQVAGVLAAEAGRLYSGEIRARHEAVLGFRTGGKIIECLVDAGTRVRAGQVLARLDPVDSDLQAGAARAQYLLAEAETMRYRMLHSKGFVSQSALDNKEAALKAASAQSGLTRNQADYTTLRAGHAGVVTIVLAEAGQVVSSGQPVLRLAQDDQTEVAIAIPETQLARHRVGDAAEVVLLADGGDGAVLTGHLRELSPSADPVSRTYQARVSFNAAPGQVALGMTARVRFTSRQQGLQGTMLLIPLTAIYQQGKQTAVWIVAADHSVSLRQVEVATYRDDGAVIVSGLAAGERIVSAGVHRLSAGEKIQLIEAAATGSSQ